MGHIIWAIWLMIWEMTVDSGSHRKFFWQTCFLETPSIKCSTNIKWLIWSPDSKDNITYYFYHFSSSRNILFNNTLLYRLHRNIISVQQSFCVLNQLGPSSTAEGGIPIRWHFEFWPFYLDWKWSVIYQTWRSKSRTGRSKTRTHMTTPSRKHRIWDVTIIFTKFLSPYVL